MQNYLVRQKEEAAARNQRAEQRVSELDPEKEFDSFWKYEITIGERPTQTQILKTHIKNWKACTAKRYGQSNEEHFFNRLLKCDRYKQKTIFIQFIEKLELKDDRFYKFPSQINEYLGRVGPCKGCCMMRFIVLLKKLRLRKFIKNIRTCYQFKFTCHNLMFLY